MDDHTVTRSAASIPDDATEFRVDFLRVSGRKGLVRLSVDDEPVAANEIPWVAGMMSSVGASFARGGSSPVSLEYAGRFPYGGTVKQVDIQLHERADAETMEAEMRAELSKQ